MHVRWSPVVHTLMTMIVVCLCAQFAVATGSVAGAGIGTVPFERTPEAIVDAMLVLANVGASSVVLDLGCGDGRVVHAAARAGARLSIGIDSNPSLVALSKQGTSDADAGSGRVVFHQDDFATTKWVANATVITLYWVPSVIERLAPRLFRDAKPGTVIVSHDYPLVGYTPSVEWFTEGFADKVRINGVNVVYLYKYIVGPKQTNDAGKRVGGATVRASEQGVSTFRLQHRFHPEVKHYTAAYSQRYVSKDGPLDLMMHIMVEDGRLKAMWLPDLLSDGKQRKIAYRARRLVAGVDRRSGAEGSGGRLVAGVNTKKGANTADVLVDNLGLGDVPLPLNFTIVLEQLQLRAPPASDQRGAVNGDL